METNSSNTPDATEALAAVAGTRAKLADQPANPWWFVPGLGACVAVMLLTASDQLPQLWLPMAITSMTALSAMATKSQGVEPRQISVCKSPRGIAVIVAFSAIMIGCIFASSAASNHHNHILGWASAIAAFLLWVAFGFTWDALWRQHLRAQA